MIATNDKQMTNHHERTTHSTRQTAAKSRTISRDPRLQNHHPRYKLITVIMQTHRQHRQRHATYISIAYYIAPSVRTYVRACRDRSSRSPRERIAVRQR